MGRTVGIVAASALLIPAVGVSARPVVSAPAPPTTVRVSIDSHQGESPWGGRLGEGRAVSAQGRWIVFQTRSNLVPEDTNDPTTTEDVYLRDQVEGTTTLVSANESGQALGGGDASVSASGRFVAFLSDAQLTAEDLDSTYDLYVRDTSAGVTRLLSVPAPASGLVAAGEATAAEISGDGSTVAFTSSQRLVKRDTDPQDATSWLRLDVYAVDVATGRLRLASLDRHHDDYEGGLALGGVSFHGRRIGFNLPLRADGMPPGYWLRNLDRPVPRLLWRERLKSGYEFDRVPALSGDGRFAVFPTEKRSVDDEGDWRLTDLVRLNLAAGTTRVVCCRVGTPYGEGTDPLRPSVSRRGDRVAFSSEGGLVTGDDWPGVDVFVADIPAGTIRLVSQDLTGLPTNNNGSSPLHSLSPDGHSVVFVGWASDLVPGDTNGTDDVFLRSRLP